MSGSKKTQSPARVARVLYDAEIHGDKVAAAKHGVHHRTVEDWRKRRGGEAAVVTAMAKLREAVGATWLTKARAAREKLIDRVVEVAEESTDLGAITKALTAVDEVIVGHEVLHDPEPDGGDSADGGRESEGQ